MYQLAYSAPSVMNKVEAGSWVVVRCPEFSLFTTAEGFNVLSSRKHGWIILNLSVFSNLLTKSISFLDSSLC